MRRRNFKTLAVLIGIPALAWTATSAGANDLRNFEKFVREAHAFNRLVQKFGGTSAFLRPKANFRHRDRVPYYSAIHQASERYQIPRPLIAAVIRCESNWDPSALSHAGARGLMQVLPKTAERTFRVHPSRLWDVETNINLGTAYLRLLANHYRGKTARVIAAYNAGPTRVDRDMRLPAETRRYQLCVSRWYSAYRKSIG